MLQQNLHPRDPLARAADVPPLAAVDPPYAYQAVISTKNNRSTSVYLDPPFALEQCPTDGTVADVESQLDIGVRRRAGVFLCDYLLVLHAINLVEVSLSYWNQDKVR
jgi:hypothetical protein